MWRAFPPVRGAGLMEGRSERRLAAGLGGEAGSQEPRNTVASGRWKGKEMDHPESHKRNAAP